MKPIDHKILKNTHGSGIKGLFRIYKKEKFIKSVKYPLIITLCACIGMRFTQANVYQVIVSLVDTAFSIMPDLLGFLLGGYALIIGLGSDKFVKSISKVSSDSPISFYQTFSSVFAFSILCLAGSLVLAFVVYLFSFIETPPVMPNTIVNAINNSVLFLLIFALTYSLFQIPVMVLNIFSFSQSHHINILSQINDDEQHSRDNEMGQ